MSLPWFRMYAEFASDPVVQSLSFDDQRHFVIILCLKCSGVLDREYGHPQARVTMLRRALGLEALGFDEAKNRLVAARLIDGDWQPVNWKKRQYISDLADPTAAVRMRRYRAKKRNGPVTLRPSESDTDTDSDKNHSESLLSQTSSFDSVGAKDGLKKMVAALAAKKAMSK